MRRGLLFISATILFALGLVLSADFIMSLGLMRGSLTHENELVRKSANMEIVIYRWGAWILASLLLVTGLFWGRLINTKWVLDTAQLGSKVSAEIRRHFGSIWNRSLLIVLIGLFGIGLYLRFGKDLFPLEYLAAINPEDGVIEWSSAAIVLFAALLSGRIALHGQATRAQVGMHCFLALLFFAMCGEEISWGQRVLGFETPEALQGINVQGEFNLHNDFGYFFDHLFVLCFFLWGCVVPLLRKYSDFFRGLFLRVGLPVPSLGLAFGMLLISMVQDVLVYRLVDPMPYLRVPELRELLSSLAFALLMFEVLRLLRLQGTGAADRQIESSAKVRVLAKGQDPFGLGHATQAAPGPAPSLSGGAADEEIV
ncbi:MAG: hypothetical protein CSA62_13605 [Planctomycetota bacterium]|nr:MAG: hypothetical protein CSA62_13605 [Planctomycetota bacterium]